MIDISKIERLCKRANLEHLPALNQLKKAEGTNDAQRIAGNIIDFLEENGLYRPSTVPPSSKLNNKSDKT
jgi:hypothetical protein